MLYNSFCFLCVLTRVLKFLVILIIKKYLCVLLERTVIKSTMCGDAFSPWKKLSPLRFLYSFLKNGENALCPFLGHNLLATVNNFLWPYLIGLIAISTFEVTYYTLDVFQRQFHGYTIKKISDSNQKYVFYTLFCLKKKSVHFL